MTDLRQRLADALEEMGIATEVEARDRLLKYQAMMLKWNKVYNLTAIHDPEKMLTHHLLDSLAIAPHVPEGRLLDVGSGAGLPGIPLAVVRPDIQVTLIDTSEKKCAFMRQAAIELGLTQTRVIHARVENHHEEAYGRIVSRAFSELNEFVRLTRHLLASDGRWLAMKGQHPREEMAELGGARVETVVELNVPGLGAERCLIVMEPVQ